MESASELKTRLAKEMARKSLMGSIFAYNVPIAAAPCLEDEVLEELRALCPKAAFVAVYVDLEEGRRWQILSRNGVHCGELARLAMDGGGNRDNGWFLQKINWGHLIVDGPCLLRTQVEYDQ